MTRHHQWFLWADFVRGYSTLLFESDVLHHAMQIQQALLQKGSRCVWLVCIMLVPSLESSAFAQMLKCCIHVGFRIQSA